MRYLRLIETEQYDAYSNATDAEKDEILQEITDNEVYLYYRVSSKVRPIELTDRLMNSEYAVPKEKVWIYKNGGMVKSKNNILIVPNYAILLCKTADNYSSVASAKLGHYGLPINIGTIDKYSAPYKPSPTKTIAETDARIYASYCGRNTIVELKDRANSAETHKIMYSNILNAPYPTRIDKVVDRKIHGFGTDDAIKLVDSIYNSMGLDFKYVSSKES